MAKINLSSLTNLQNESSVTATINNNNTLIAQAVENSISRDGTQPNQMNSRLDMNSNQIINLPDATSDQEPVTYGQYLDGITSVNNGVVVDGDFVVLAHNDTMTNDRLLTPGSNIGFVDEGPKGKITIGVNDPELNALAGTFSATDKLPYFTDVGAADVTDFTPFARTLLDDADASTMRDTLGLTLGTDTQPHSDLLDSLNASDTGVVTKTDANTITPRTITGTGNEITVSNGNGVSGNPTISLPSSITLTGKTISGGNFSSPAINTPTGITKSDVGLSNVDNTSDVNKPISTATQTALNAKVAGPASSVNGNIPTFSGTTGKIIADGGKSLPTGTIVGTTDTQVLTNKTISGSSNTLSNISNASLTSVADSTIKSNISGSSATPSDNTITAVLDKQLGTSQGSIAYRGASSWSSLTPGTSGTFLQTQGTGANPQWTAIPGGGDLLSTNNLSDVADASISRDNLGIQKKNYIVNGAMMVSQQYGTASGTVNSYYPVDQFRNAVNLTTGSLSFAQINSTSLSGSPNRVRVTVSSANVSPGVNDYGLLLQHIEGFRVADLKLGSANAKTMVLSFGVKAPAGTYCISFRNGSSNRTYIAEYVISGGEANTDVIKSVVVPGDITGTWATDNSIGLAVAWSFVVGSANQTSAGTWVNSSYFSSSNQFNLMSTNGNVFELFDVGLYEGDVAPDFVVPNFQTELNLCQRYFQQLTTAYGHGHCAGTGAAYGVIDFPSVEMRVTPTIVSSGTFNTWSPGTGNLTVTVNPSIYGGFVSTSRALLSWTASGLTGVGAITTLLNSSNSKITFDARM